MLYAVWRKKISLDDFTKIDQTPCLESFLPIQDGDKKLSYGKLKELLDGLNNQEKAEVILCFSQWMIQDYLFGIKNGSYKAPAGEVELVYNSDPGLRERLAESVRTNDKRRMLKAGVVEVFRGIRIMQRESSGPRFNAFLRRHLSDRVFRELYRAAGLDTDTIVYDLNFPVELMTLKDI